jgi:hypothetical protein
MMSGVAPGLLFGFMTLPVQMWDLRTPQEPAEQQQMELIQQLMQLIQD